MFTRILFLQKCSVVDGINVPNTGVIFQLCLKIYDQIYLCIIMMFDLWEKYGVANRRHHEPPPPPPAAIRRLREPRSSAAASRDPPSL